jgi:hypothetical protein
MLLLAACAAEAADFAQAPTARRVDGGFEIRFAVREAGYAQVAIHDAAGRVVRHLAAGLLGVNAPAPFAKGSLTQRLAWDGRDNLGRPAAGGPFNARVALGLTPRFARIMGDSSGFTGEIVGLANDPRNGELFVLHRLGNLHPGDASTLCTVFDREGRYRRTILPWPATVGPERLPGLKRLSSDGASLPYLYNAETRSLLPGVGNLELTGPVVTDEGLLLFVNHRETTRNMTRYNQPGIRQVLAIRCADGSLPTGGVERTVLANYSVTAIHLAAAPDNRTLYAAGVGTKSDKSTKGQHAIHRFTLDDERSTPFIGKPDEAGAGAEKLNGPQDVAVDREGNLLVADSGNHRIAAFDATGRFLGQLALRDVKRVAVSRKSGAIFAIVSNGRTNALVRFVSLESKEPTARLELPAFRHWRPVLLSLDDSGPEPVLWFSSPGTAYATPRFTLLRIATRAGQFDEPLDVGLLQKAPALGPVRFLALDRARRRLFANTSLFDLSTGETLPGIGNSTHPESGIGAKGGYGSVGLDGNIYLMGYPKWMLRLGADLKPKPFAPELSRGGRLEGPKWSTGLRLRARGVTADPAGNIYALWQYWDGKTKIGYQDPNRLTVHDPSGKIVSESLIDSEIRPIGSVRLDYKGNIWLAVGVRPAGQDLPEGITGIEPFKKMPGKTFDTNTIDWYHLLYGSIVKFPPQGGAIRAGAGGIAVTTSLDAKTAIRNAEWLYYGASPVASWRQKWPDTCLCDTPSIDVDGFGRCLFPDAARFRVGLLDTAGNPICWAGAYGNNDSAGPDSAIPQPEIPLLWADNLALADDELYLGDRLNCRVVVVKLIPDAEAKVPLN